MMHAGIWSLVDRVGAVALNRPGRWGNGPYLKALFVCALPLIAGYQTAPPPVASQGRRLVLFLNDAPLGARRIEQAMPDGVVLVFVETPDAEHSGLVSRLKRTFADLLAARKAL